MAPRPPITVVHINDLKVEDVIIKPMIRSPANSNFVYYRFNIATTNASGASTLLAIQMNETFSSGIRGFADKLNPSKISYQQALTLHDPSGNADTLARDKINSNKLIELKNMIKKKVLENFHTDVAKIDRELGGNKIKNIPSMETLPFCISKLDNFVYVPESADSSPILNPKIIADGAGIRSTLRLGKIGSNRVKTVTVEDLKAQNLVALAEKEYHHMRVETVILLDSIFVKSTFGEFTIQCKVLESVLFPIESSKATVLDKYQEAGSDEEMDEHMNDAPTTAATSKPIPIPATTNAPTAKVVTIVQENEDEQNAEENKDESDSETEEESNSESEDEVAPLPAPAAKVVQLTTPKVVPLQSVANRVDTPMPAKRQRKVVAK
jgi:hypothetical protein